MGKRKILRAVVAAGLILLGLWSTDASADIRYLMKIDAPLRTTGGAERDVVGIWPDKKGPPVTAIRIESDGSVPITMVLYGPGEVELGRVSTTGAAADIAIPQVSRIFVRVVPTGGRWDSPVGQKFQMGPQPSFKNQNRLPPYTLSLVGPPASEIASAAPQANPPAADRPAAPGTESLEQTYARLCGAGQRSEACDALRGALVEKLARQGGAGSVPPAVARAAGPAAATPVAAQPVAKDDRDHNDPSCAPGGQGFVCDALRNAAAVGADLKQWGDLIYLVGQEESDIYRGPLHGYKGVTRWSWSHAPNQGQYAGRLILQADAYCYYVSKYPCSMSFYFMIGDDGKIYYSKFPDYSNQLKPVSGNTKAVVLIDEAGHAHFQPNNEKVGYVLRLANGTLMKDTFAWNGRGTEGPVTSIAPAFNPGAFAEYQSWRAQMLQGLAQRRASSGGGGLLQGLYNATQILANGAGGVPSSGGVENPLDPNSATNVAFRQRMAQIAAQGQGSQSPTPQASPPIATPPAAPAAPAVGGAAPSPETHRRAYVYCTARIASAHAMYFSSIAYLVMDTDWPERKNAVYFRDFVAGQANVSADDVYGECMLFWNQAEAPTDMARVKGYNTGDNVTSIDLPWAPKEVPN